MRVAAITSFDGPAGIEIRERPDPDPAPGEAVIDVRACSINHHDLWILRGESRLVPDGALPFVTGLDAAGVVSTVGDGVDGVEPGDRVVLCPLQTCGECEYCRQGPENHCNRFMLYHGALAEQATVDASRLIPLPEDVSFAAAAALPTAYLTAWRMLKLADVGPTDLVFIPGATGGVGVAAVQLAGVLGAATIGTSSSAAKLSRVRELGCDHTIESTDPAELETEVRGIGEPDAVINHLGGEYTQTGLSVMRRAATMVVCGRTAGGESSIDVGPFFLQQQRLIGSTMGTQPELETLVELVAQGAFDPPIGETYPLEETADAFAAMDDRELFGKLVIEPE